MIESNKLNESKIESASREIQQKGYTLIRNYVSIEFMESYLKHCAKKLESCPRMEAKCFSPGSTPDYVQPWSINYGLRKIASYRLYEYYHNPHPKEFKSFFDEVIKLRDHFELPWKENLDKYNLEKGNVDFNIITKYNPGSGYLVKHRDLDEKFNFLSLQCLFQMTKFKEDFTGGELVLFGYDGSTLRLNEDLNFDQGDLLLFDKRMLHEVQSVLPGVGSNRGRWSALIGAKTIPRPQPTAYMNWMIRFKRFRDFRISEIRQLLGQEVIDVKESLY